MPAIENQAECLSHIEREIAKANRTKINFKKASHLFNSLLTRKRVYPLDDIGSQLKLLRCAYELTKWKLELDSQPLIHESDVFNDLNIDMAPFHMPVLSRAVTVESEEINLLDMLPLEEIIQFYLDAGDIYVEYGYLREAQFYYLQALYRFEKQVNSNGDNCHLLEQKISNSLNKLEVCAYTVSLYQLIKTRIKNFPSITLENIDNLFALIRNRVGSLLVSYQLWKYLESLYQPCLDALKFYYINGDISDETLEATKTPNELDKYIAKLKIIINQLARHGQFSSASEICFGICNKYNNAIDEIKEATEQYTAEFNKLGMQYSRQAENTDEERKALSDNSSVTGCLNWKSFRNNWRELTKSSVNQTDIAVNLATYSRGMLSIIEQMAGACKEVIGGWEHHFALVATGSITREELGIDSDLDIACLVSGGSCRSDIYITCFIELFKFYCTFLVTGWDIVEDKKVIRGFQIDGSDITHLINQDEDKLWLINTPDALSNWVVTRFEATDNNTITDQRKLAFGLLQPVLLQPNAEKAKQLFSDYQDKLLEKLRLLPGKQLISHKQLAAKYFDANQLDVCQYDTLEPLDALIIKEKFIKPFTLWYFTASLYFGLTDDNKPLARLTKQIFEQFVQRKIFPNYFINWLKQTWRRLHEIRYSVLLKQSDHNKLLAELNDIYHRILQPLWLTYPQLIKSPEGNEFDPIDVWFHQKYPDVMSAENELSDQLKVDLSIWLKSRSENKANFEHYENVYIRLSDDAQSFLLDELEQLGVDVTIIEKLVMLPRSNGSRQSQHYDRKKLLACIDQLVVTASKKPTNNNAGVSFTLHCPSCRNKPEQMPNQAEFQYITASLQLPGEDTARALKPIVIHHLLDAQTGRIREKNCHSDQHSKSARHRVVGIILHDGSQDYAVHVKERADHPGMDYAINSLRHHLFGHGSPANRVAKLIVVSTNPDPAKCYTRSYPVLVSTTISSPQENLATYLASPNKSLKLDFRRFFESALFDMVAHPGDGDARNYQVETLNSGLQELICIDNDQYFVQPIVKVKSAIKLLLRSVLFCFPEMLKSQNTNILPMLSAFINLDIKSLLKHWLHDVTAYEENVLRLFTKDERKLLLQKDTQGNFVSVHLLFAAGTIFRLGTDLLNLQMQMQIALNRQRYPSPFEWLQYLHDLVSSKYKKELDNNSLTIKTRFENITNHAQVSQTSSQAVQASLGVIPSFEEIEVKRKYSAKKAIVEVASLDNIVIGDYVPVLTESNSAFLILNFQLNKPSEEQQKALLKIPLYRCYSHITICNCDVLDEKILTDVLEKTGGSVISLRLQHCRRLIDNWVPIIIKHCPKLQELRLINNPNLTSVTIVEYTPTIFRWNARPLVLQHLNLSHNHNLTTITINVPSLKKLKTKNCPRLKQRNEKDIENPTKPPSNSKLKKKYKDIPFRLNFDGLPDLDPPLLSSHPATDTRRYELEKKYGHLFRKKPSQDENKKSISEENILQNLNNSASRKNVKIVLIGDYFSGKTSILKQYHEACFFAEEKPTINTTIFTKDVEIDDNKCQLQILDSPGAEWAIPLVKEGLKDAAIVMVVYDITSKNSFNRILTLKKVFENDIFPDCSVILVGNKSDLDDRRRISREEGKELRREIGAADFFECSAKDGTNINEIFETAARAALNKLTSAQELKTKDRPKLKDGNVKAIASPKLSTTKKLAKASVDSPGFFQNQFENNSEMLPQKDLNKDDLITMKFVIVGADGVGKSSIFARYCKNEFTLETKSTIGLDLSVRNIQMNGKDYKLQIWDTASQERFNTILKSYYKGATAVLIVYDVTREDTLDEVQRRKSEIELHAPPNCPVILVGNKSDIEDRRKVSKVQGEELRKEIGAAVFFECSAKTGDGVDAVFEAAVTLARFPKAYVPQAKRLKAPNLNEVQAENDHIKTEIIKAMPPGIVESKSFERPLLEINLGIVGADGAGKSCMVTRYCHEFALTSPHSSVGLQSVEIAGKRYRLAIWTMNEQEKNYNIIFSLYSNAVVILIVYDIASRYSFDEVQRCKRYIELHAPPNCNVILVGNKSDLEDRRQVSKEEGERLSREIGAAVFFECSAKTGQGVDDIFKMAATLFLEKLIETPKRAPAASFEDSYNQYGVFDAHSIKSVGSAVIDASMAAEAGKKDFSH